MTDPIPPIPPRRGASSPAPDSLASRAATVAAAAAAVGLVVAIFVYAATGFLLLFAGLLLAVLLDALTRGLGFVLPLPRWARFTIVCIALVALFAAFAAAIGTTAMRQGPQLMETLEAQLRGLQDAAEDLVGEDAETDGGEETEGNGGAGGWTAWLPDPGGLVGQAGAAFATAFGVVGNIGIILVVGVFIGAQPMLYRDGAIRLVPRDRRARIGQVLDGIGETLRYWMVGQFATMSIIGVVVWAALTAVGMPAALLLALIAGLLNFVPFVGPILAGIPIVLVAMSQDWWLVAYALGVYVVIQMLEGNVLTPLIQRRAVHLAPALIIGAQVILSFLFGLFGLVLATPLAAVAKVAVDRLYVEDVLGDRAGDV